MSAWHCPVRVKVPPATYVISAESSSVRVLHVPHASWTADTTRSRLHISACVTSKSARATSRMHRPSLRVFHASTQVLEVDELVLVVHPRWVLAAKISEVNFVSAHLILTKTRRPCSSSS